MHTVSPGGDGERLVREVVMPLDPHQHALFNKKAFHLARNVT